MSRLASGASAALARLRGAKDDTSAVADEFADLEEAQRAADRTAAAATEDGEDGGKSGWQGLLAPGVRRLLLVCMGLQMFQQVTGINAVVYFTPQTLKEVGVPKLFSALGLNENAGSILGTMLAYLPKIPSLFLAMSLMDKLGRRRLLQLFVPLMGMCLAGLATSFSFMASGGAFAAALAMTSVCLYGSFFVLSLGPIPNILTSEVFPTRVRSPAMSMSLFSQFFFNALVGMAFPILRHKLGTQAVFATFSTMCLLCWLFVNKFVPETKGMSLEKLAEGAKV